MTRKRQASEFEQKIDKKITKKARRDNYANVYNSDSDNPVQIERQGKVDWIYDEGPGGQALQNPIIMEKISGFLNHNDIYHWYVSTK